MCIENCHWCHISVKFVHFKTQISPLNSAFYAADAVECFLSQKLGISVIGYLGYQHTCAVHFVCLCLL